MTDALAAVRTARADDACAALTRQLLGEGLTRRFGRPISVLALESGQLDAQSTYPIDRLTAALDSGERLPLIFKRLGPTEGSKGARREVLIYQRLLAGERFGAPAVYASVYDEAHGRYWLFLEYLGEETLRKGDHEDWMAAVRLLAEMHGTYLGREADLRALGCLAEHGPQYYQGVADTARCHLIMAGAASAVGRFNAVMTRFPSLIAHLVRQPRTLVHGDIFPENLLVQPGPRVRPVDWESAAIGLGAWELARLLDGWGRDRPSFIAAYLDTLSQVSGMVVDRAEFARTFACGETLNLFLHLGWEADNCHDPEFVDWLLTELEKPWPHVDSGL
jgi:aminoglycoside phosphotransferase (APT) family kinase protein